MNFYINFVNILSKYFTYIIYKYIFHRRNPSWHIKFNLVVEGKAGHYRSGGICDDAARFATISVYFFPYKTSPLTR